MSPRRRSRRNRRPVRRLDPGPWIGTVATVLCLAGGAAYVSGGGTVTVERVVDGDTFETSEGEMVRVLGIDSCERSERGGPRATADAEELLAGREVTLDSEPGVDRDRWGRSLRYVTLPDGRDFAVAMVGFDHTTTYPDGDASEDRMTNLEAADGEPKLRCDR